MRVLTSDEQKKVRAARKQSKPAIYESATGTLQEISDHFEAFLILADPGVKAKAATYLTIILKFDINNLSDRNKLMARWLDDEINDLNKAVDGYKDILDQYDDIKDDLASFVQGFEDVPEVNLLLTDFTLALGDYVEQRDSFAFQRAVNSVLNGRRQGQLPEYLKREIESIARVLLAY